MKQWLQLLITYLIFYSKSIIIGILYISRNIFHSDVKFHWNTWTIGQLIYFFQAYPVLITWILDLYFNFDFKKGTQPVWVEPDT